MKPQFTPGPYAISEDHFNDTDGTVLIYQQSDAQGEIPVGLVFTPESFDPDGYEIGERDLYEVECRANARLFKHAPEMFYALERFAGIDENDAWKIGMKTEVDELRKLLEQIISDKDGE